MLYINFSLLTGSSFNIQLNIEQADVRELPCSHPTRGAAYSGHCHAFLQEAWAAILDRSGYRAKGGLSVAHVLNDVFSIGKPLVSVDFSGIPGLTEGFITRSQARVQREWQ